MSSRSYDIAVIGAGVIGAAIAAQLSRYAVRVVWFEAAHDVAEGASKANSAIACTGFDMAPGSLESDLILQTNPQWENICRALDVPLRRIGALSLAFDDGDSDSLRNLLNQAREAGIEAELIAGDALRREARTAAPSAIEALHVPREGIIDPIRLTVGLAKLAVLNGVELRCSTPVTGFRHHPSGAISHVVTPTGATAVGAVVNAAGVNADLITDAAVAEPFTMWPRKGQFLLLDRAVGHLVPKIMCTAPTPHTRGIYAVPTTNRTVLVGPTAVDGDDRGDKTTDGDTLDAVWARAERLLPEGVERRHVTKTFSGLRPASDRTYRIEVSAKVPNLVHAAGIRSTGVSAAPGVASYVADLIGAEVMELPVKSSVRESIPVIPRLAEIDTDVAATAFTARPGAAPDEHPIVVCACEHVTAAEIAAECRGPVPATSLDGVRKRTRATAGRCQGAYCSVGVSFILSAATGDQPGEVRHGEPGSHWETPVR
ncbi:NAD(P)/FAD-dependent oxidoreductase [Mycolicibacterium confluentis]|uniref:FAD/NAD(P)-binding oxidoreductase n=1 Tax=Mycolicibacterium confluentis TaxID=28047 RepID=A0A7I7XRY5_9MYCO|nr:FAD-dependent oxidoreductase [Mycolicibacterium confluentis]MCV7318884.1 FAD-dependent oxidoreductase [Mycolicibacterium confluentis]ORV23016.1 FAD/NAD(P)-binding oxidoreductase [Mycolicibacterium confluentis]BBZ32036.1 FAD/NAD(P)-binding oxidoreductase [Mycolicibacterium confluentis]